MKKVENFHCNPSIFSIFSKWMLGGMKKNNPNVRLTPNFFCRGIIYFPPCFTLDVDWKYFNIEEGWFLFIPLDNYLNTRYYKFWNHHFTRQTWDTSQPDFQVRKIKKITSYYLTCNLHSGILSIKLQNQDYRICLHLKLKQPISIPVEKFHDGKIEWREGQTIIYSISFIKSCPSMIDL